MEWLYGKEYMIDKIIELKKNLAKKGDPYMILRVKFTFSHIFLYIGLI